MFGHTVFAMCHKYEEFNDDIPFNPIILEEIMTNADKEDFATGELTTIDSSHIYH